MQRKRAFGSGIRRSVCGCRAAIKRDPPESSRALRVADSVFILVDARDDHRGSSSKDNTTNAHCGVEANKRMTDVQTQTHDLPEIPAPITLTDKAVAMVKEAIVQENLEGHALRIGVTGGGCAGLQYLLDFSEKATEDDFVLELDGIKVFIDPFSAAHLDGTVIDYVDGLNGSGFKFDNPRIVRSCGCGMSFQ